VIQNCLLYKDGEGVTCCKVCGRRFAKDTSLSSIATCKKKATTPLTIEQKIGVGPGTELTRLIPDFFSSADCGCKNFAKLMNSWGVDGCREKKQEIIDRLVQQSNNTVLLKLFPDGATSIVASKMIDKAIKNYEEKVNNGKA